MEDNLKNMQMFLNNDLKIKKILYNIEPKEEYKYNKDSCIEYGNKLYKAIEDIEFYILQIVSKYFINEEQYCKNYFATLKSQLLKIGYDLSKLSKFYQVCISSMSEEFVNKVGENCVGYTIFRDISFNDANSVNELLHLIHQSIINDEKILQSMPELNSKVNNHGYSITLYGFKTDLATKIYEKFPPEIDCGWTDIIALNDKIIMMIRDKGHALSIEIEKENDKYYIKYFIPKICNVGMVNQLKGVNMVNDESKYTVGVFQTNESNLPFELYDFINKVPMDKDMDIYRVRL